MDAPFLFKLFKPYGPLLSLKRKPFGRLLNSFLFNDKSGRVDLSNKSAQSV
jgi:hypothetical protein